MQQKQTTHPKVAQIIEKYGQGFDVIYFDGYEDGYKEAYEETKAKISKEIKVNAAKNLLTKGVDEKIISECTGISIEELKKLKRKL